MAMSMNTGGLGWKAQTDKGVAPTGAFYWHKVPRMSIGIEEIADVLPPEIGSGLLPGGAFKAGYWSEGGFDMVPRVDNNIGWLFLSFAGSATVSGTGPYTHIFNTPATGIPESWLTFRRLLPQDDGQFFGETLADSKVLNINLMADAASLLAMRCGVRGLGATPNYNATGTGWAPTTDNGGYEQPSGIPITSVAGLTMADNTPLTTVTSAALQLGNAAPEAKAEMVIGSYVPHHISVLARSVQISLTAFWENADLYQKIKNGNGSTWSPVPYRPTDAFGMYFRTPGNLVGGAYPGELGFWAPAGGVFWQMRGIDARAGNIAVIELLGTVLDIPGNPEPWRLWLKNSRATAYTPA